MCVLKGKLLSSIRNPNPAAFLHCAASAWSNLAWWEVSLPGAGGWNEMMVRPLPTQTPLYDPMMLFPPMPCILQPRGVQPAPPQPRVLAAAARPCYPSPALHTAAAPSETSSCSCAVLPAATASLLSSPPAQTAKCHLNVSSITCCAA